MKNATVGKRAVSVLVAGVVLTGSFMISSCSKNVDNASKASNSVTINEKRIAATESEIKEFENQMKQFIDFQISNPNIDGTIDYRNIDIEKLKRTISLDKSMEEDSNYGTYLLTATTFLAYQEDKKFASDTWYKIQTNDENYHLIKNAISAVARNDKSSIVTGADFIKEVPETKKDINKDLPLAIFGYHANINSLDNENKEDIELYNTLNKWDRKITKLISEESNSNSRLDK